MARTYFDLSVKLYTTLNFKLWFSDSKKFTIVAVVVVLFKNVLGAHS